jgi:subtilisin family serine protease/subtilisin-like proprotein convertase family protein
LEDRRLLNAESRSYLVEPKWFEQFNTPASVPVLSLTSSHTLGPQAAESTSPTEWIVQLTDQASRGLPSVSAARDLLSPELPFDLRSGLGRVGQFLISTRADDADVAKLLSSNQYVASFEHNAAIWSRDALPNDARLSDLWGMNNTGQTGGAAGADIHASAAWDIATGSRDIVVAVIDSGLDYNHPDLVSNVWTNPGELAGNGLDDDANGFIDDVHGYDFVNNDGDPMDDDGHGTHVAGTIGAVGNNDVGVAGVNWSTSIMALKFLDAAGSGRTADAVRAVNYATMMREQYGVDVRVTNNSWGGGGFSQSLKDAIEASGTAGILFVAAAGNDGEDNDTTPRFPSGYGLSNIVTVAATDASDTLARFSNFGVTTVDLAAPGDAILSTLPNNSYGLLSGTSMATPHVSGVAALAWSISPTATVSQVRAALVDGVEPVASLSGRVKSGGRLNARATIDRLGMNVAMITPAHGAVLSTPPTEFQVSFTHPFQADSVQPADLVVNGVAASGVTIDDADTAIFTFKTSPVTEEGVQEIHVEGGSILRQTDADPVKDFQSTFYFDTLPGAVVSSTPSADAVVAAAPSSIVLGFNEPIDPASIGVDDLELDNGIVVAAAAVSATQVRYDVSRLIPDGEVHYELRRQALVDLHGSPIGSYAGHFTIDDPLVHRFSSNVQMPIRDLGTITSTIDVPEEFTIADLDVEIDIMHTYDSDLDVAIISPNGVRIELFSDVGGSGDNFIGAVFDDEAATPIGSGTAPFTGRFRPEMPLAGFAGLSVTGTWTLEVTDDAGADVGSLGGWRLVIRQNADVPPRITAVDPLPTDFGATWTPIETLIVHLAEKLQPQSVSAANWELREAGADETWDTADDVLIELTATPPYTGGLTVELAIADAPLVPGSYQFRALPGLLDVVGNPLDGNSDGVGGDPYVRRFTVLAVEPDEREPNDSFAKAADFGELQNSAFTNLSIHAPGNEDYYRFTPGMSGTLTADVLFKHSAGDINAALYDADETLLAAATSTSDHERIFYPVTSGEVYYLRVYGEGRAVNPFYSLELNVSETPMGDRFEPNDSRENAHEFGEITSVEYADLSIHLPGNDDFYRFSPAIAGALAADVLFSHVAGDLDAVLYDSSGNRLTYSESRTNNERIVWNVTAGTTYYLQIYGYQGAVNPSYGLHILVSQSPIADRFEPNDGFTTATDFGPLAGRVEPSLSIHAANNDDYYRWTAETAGVLTAEVLFRNADGDIDVELYDAARTLLRSSASATDNERVVWNVSAGATYFLRVYGYNGTTNRNYSISLDVVPAPAGDRFEPNDNFDQATDLGPIGSRTESALSIHSPHNNDYYRFTSSITGILEADVLFSDAAGDLDAELYNGARTLLKSSASSGDNERIMWAVTAGQTYYVLVHGFLGDTNPSYTLQLGVTEAPPGDRYESNDSFAEATDWGVVLNRTETDLSIHLPDNDDYYRFNAGLTGTLMADLLFDDAAGDLDLVLYNSNRTRLRTSDSDTDNEQIRFSVIAGQTYYLRVLGFGGDTNENYTLSAAIGVEGTPEDDVRFITASENGSTLEIYGANPPPPGSTPLFTWPIDATIPLTIDLLSGDDTLIVSLPAEVKGPSGGISVEMGEGANNRLLVSGGEVRIDAKASGGTLNTTVLGDGHLVTERLVQSSVTLADEARLTLLPDGGTSRLAALMMDSQTQFDITNNALIIDYTSASPSDVIRDYLIAGRGGAGGTGDWTGKGITSSTAAADNAASHSVGYAENSNLPLGPFSSFHGEPVDATSVLIAYTVTADANLDGVVNDDDATILSASYAPAESTPKWTYGDFDYDGFVGDDDATLLGAFYAPAGVAPQAATKAGPLEARRHDEVLDRLWAGGLIDASSADSIDQDLLTLLTHSMIKGDPKRRLVR